MTVQKVEQQKPKSGLLNGIKSAVIGGAIGYGAVYALPLAPQEKDNEYRAVVKSLKEQAVKARKEFKESIKGLTMTPSHDAYIKSMPKIAENSVRTYNQQLKSARSAYPFVIAGLAAGLVTSFVRNVFCTDIN